MVGAALFFLSTFALTATRFRDRPGAERLAAAALAALAVPVLVLVLAARAGLPPSFPLVLAAHLGLWFVAVGGRAPASPARPDADGDALVPAVLAAAVALASALLGPDPARDPLYDPWGHLAYSRALVRSFDLYPPAFPALLATLTPFDRLGGAFRTSALVLHFALAAQFVAIGGRGSDRGRAALAALAYLLVPAASRADPPRPELLGAVVLAAACGAALSRDLSPRARALSLGLLALLLLLSHVSTLEIVLVPALGVIALATERGARARLGILGAVLAGAVAAFALSPFLVMLAIAPQRVTALAQQPAMLAPIPLRAIVSGLGLPLAGVVAAGLLRWAAGWRAIERGERVALVVLPVAAALLLAPIALAAAGVHLPVKLFTERLLLAGALPLALAGAVGGDERDRSRGRTAALVLALAGLALAQVLRPAAPAGQRLAAALVAAAAGGLVVPGGTRWRAAGVAALVVAGAVVRLWIWTPALPAAARWLAARPERWPVVTNWPVTNELDALLETPVIDGLAGRDANIALHRAGGVSALHARLDWCADTLDVERLASFLRERGDRAAWIALDPRFAAAWQLYRRQREQVVSSGDLARYPWLAAAPCTLDAGGRLGRMDSILRASARVTPMFASSGATVYRLDASGAIPPRPPEARPAR